MKPVQRIQLGICLALCLIFSVSIPAAAQEPTPSATAPARILTAPELLAMVNAARKQIGHPALIFDSILVNYSQELADRAANSLPGQAVSAVDAVIQRGYGYPETSETIFCTSSSATMEVNNPDPVGSVGFGTVAERAVNNVYYRHIGFGISVGTGDMEGYVVYVLLACYDADRFYTPNAPTQIASGTPATAAVSQLIIPVRTAAPQADGRLIHEVRSGQTLWAIAVAYNTHIKDILALNLLPPDTSTLYQGQKLLIPTPPGGLLPPAVVAAPLATIIVPSARPEASVSMTPSSTAPALQPSPSPAPDQNERSTEEESNIFLIIGAFLAACLALVLLLSWRK